MTSSRTPTDRAEIGDASPSVNDMTDSPDTMRWGRRGAAIASLGIGWLFILWQNHFHLTAPTVFLCLGYLAVIATIYNLWRTGAAAADSSDEDDDSTLAKPAGALGALEREKRTLLKAIKEAEFDRDMGKLSQRDADDMIRGYRARAIEVIKEIDLLGQGGVGTVREQILREVRARVQLDDKAAKARPGKAESKPKAEARAARPDAKPEAKPGATSARPAGASDPAAGAPLGIEPPLAAASGPAASPERAAEAGKPVMPRDEELDADSTTAPAHDEPAKEATP
jgi:hypothetical protein